MWRNYLTVGVRALAKNKTYALINILGLAIGMAACLVLLLFVRYELTYDQDLPGSENAYQLQTYYTDPDTGEEGNLQMSAYATKQALLKDFPQIEQVVYAQWSGPVVIKDGEAFDVEDFKFVDGPLFEILHFPFIQGNSGTALAQPGSIVLSESEAKKRFGDENPMGQTLTVVAQGKNTDYRVTGIVQDPPKNSHFKFTMAARYDPAVYWADSPDFLTSWGWQNGHMYVQLKPGADPEAIRSQFQAWEKRNIPDQIFGGQRFNQGDQADFGLVNIRDVHLGEAQDGAMTPGNDRRSIITFAIVALLILGMACVNFTNLATARASQRAREVALRKVLGANRKQLVIQFIGESVLVAAFAMLLALAMTELALPVISSFLEADLTLTYFGEGGLILPILALVLLVGAAGGLYPAFYLSRFQPAQVLKANKSSAEAQGTGRLRSVLVVSQFAVSIGLIICTAVVYLQTVHARTTDPGFNRQGLIQVEGIGRQQLEPIVEPLVRQISRLDGVVGTGRTTIGIATGMSSNTGVQLPGREDSINIGQYNVDETFFETMGIELLAGRAFDENRPADNSETPFPEDLAAGSGGQDAQGQPCRSRIWRRGAGHHHRRGRGFPLPIDPRADRFDHVLLSAELCEPAARPLRQRQSRRGARADRGGVEANGAGGAVRRQVQRGDHRRALRGGGFPRDDLRRVRDPRRRCRLSRPLRPRRLHRRAADQGDRHQEGDGRAHPRHRPAARLAVLQAGDHRQPHRLAGCLVGDARLAQQLRRPHRPGADALRPGGGDRPRHRHRHHSRARA